MSQTMWSDVWQFILVILIVFLNKTFHHAVVITCHFWIVLSIKKEEITISINLNTLIILSIR